MRSLGATAISLDMDEQPNLNTGTPWSTWDDEDIRWGLDDDRSIEETAELLCRTPSEICQRSRAIARADAIGDPLLLRDGLNRARPYRHRSVP